MSNCIAGENFELGFSAVRSTLEQLEIWYGELYAENKILWDIISEIDDEAIWRKLLTTLINKYRNHSNALIIQIIRRLLENENYSVALLALNHLLRISNDEEPSETLQLAIPLILEHMLSIEISDVDEMDRLLITTMGWIKNSTGSKLRASVHKYLVANHAKLFQFTADTNSPDLILAYLYTLLNFECYSLMREMLEYLLYKEWPFLDAKLQEEQFAHFLWLTSYLSMDDLLLEVSKQSNHLIEQSNLPELILYKKYNAAKNRGQNDDKTLNDIVALMTQGLIFEEHEKVKLWNEIIKFQQEKIIAPAYTSEVQTNVKKTDNIWQIKNKTDHCPQCIQSKLVNIQVSVEGFTKKSPQAQKLVILELLTCERCQKIYAYDSLKQELYRALAPYRCRVELDPLEYPQKKAVTKPIKPVANKVIGKRITPIGSEYFKWPSTEAKESQGQTNKESNFRDESPLHRQGYRITGLNRTQRWNILVNKAIPQITLKEIAYTIAHNIRLRKAQPGGQTKFSYAIGEWEHDLKQLKAEYYKSNFTWPHY